MHQLWWAYYITMGHWRVWKRGPYGFEPWSIGFIQPAYHTSNVNKLQKDSWKKINIFTFNKPKMFWNRVFFSNSNCPRGNRIKPASTPEANLDEGQNYAVSFIKSLFYFETKWSLLVGIKKYAFCQCYDANERVKVRQLNKMSITFLFSFVICYGW